jgi:hypothetical protein
MQSVKQIPMGEAECLPPSQSTTCSINMQTNSQQFIPDTKISCIDAGMPRNMRNSPFGMCVGPRPDVMGARCLTSLFLRNTKPMPSEN